MSVTRMKNPLLTDLKSYTSQVFKSDLGAALTVAILLVPQGMAYAMIAGLPPIYGLYTASIPCIVYALFGTSRQLAVGPVAIISLLTATSIASAAPEASADTYINAAITLALLTGLIQILLAVIKAGYLVRFISNPVIVGFTAAAAIIIGVSQLKHLLRIEVPRGSSTVETIGAIFTEIGTSHLPTLIIGLVGVTIFLLARKYKSPIPGPALIVILSILASYFLGLEGYGVKVLGDIPHGLPSFALPGVSVDLVISLLPYALIIALIGYMEGFAIAKAVNKNHKNYKVQATPELYAIGIANVVGSLFMSYPVAGGLSRTVVNDQSGAKTNMASLMTGILLLLILAFFTTLLYHLPLAVLASIILVAVSRLFSVEEISHLWHQHREEFWMMLATLLTTVFVSVELGILVGVGLSIAMILYRSSNPHVAVLGQIPDSNVYRNVNRFSEVLQRNDIYIIRYDAQIYFANIEHLEEQLLKAIEESSDTLKLIILDMESVTSIDSSGLIGLENIIEHIRSKGLDLYLTGVRGPVRDKLGKCGLLAELVKEHVFINIDAAVQHFDSPEGHEHCHQDYAQQFND